MGRPPKPKTGYSDVLLREMNEVVQTKDGQKMTKMDAMFKNLVNGATKGDLKNILVVLNMTPMKREYFRVGVPAGKKCKLLLNSDEKRFGGTGSIIPAELTAQAGECDGLPYYIEFDLPALGAAVFTF